LAVLVVLAGVCRVEADPIFVKSRLKLRAEASVDPDPFQWEVSDRYLTGAYADMQGNAAASSSTGNGSITSVASASVTWESTARGHVSFSNTGYLWAVLAASGRADLNGSYWSYRFTTQNEDTFTLDYDVGIGTASTVAGVQGFALAVYQDNQFIYGEQMDLETSGTIQVPLAPHGNFMVVILPQGDLSSGPDLGVTTMWGEFEWQID
jgi:hypothetical protein